MARRGSRRGERPRASDHRYSAVLLPLICCIFVWGTVVSMVAILHPATLRGAHSGGAGPGHHAGTRAPRAESTAARKWWVAPRHLAAARASLPRGRGTAPDAAAAGGAGPGCRKMPALGFDYPPLRSVRRALAAIHCHPPPSHAAAVAAYRAALRDIDPGGGGGGRTGAPAPADEAAGNVEAAGAAALRHFAGLVLSHIKGDGHVLACRLDPTLPVAGAASGTGGAAGGLGVADAAVGAGRVLFAANLSNSGALAPNLIAQLLRLALLLPRGRLAVSVFESGSSDLTRQWLSLLRMALVPLGVPHNITLGGALRRTPGGGRIEFMAALRNAALEPFLTGSPGGGGPGDGSPGGAASSGAWRPDTLLFANDVFFCAGDALRLLAHGADLACGLDFYTGAWQAGAAAQARGDKSSGSGGEDEGQGGGSKGDSGEEGDEDDVVLLRQLGQHEGGASSGAKGRRRLLRVGPPGLRPWQELPSKLGGGAEAAAAAVEEAAPPLQLRFYDKVSPVRGRLRPSVTMSLHQQQRCRRGVPIMAPRLALLPPPLTRNAPSPAPFTRPNAGSGWRATSPAPACATCRRSLATRPRARASPRACPSPRSAAGTASPRCAPRRCWLGRGCGSARRGAARGAPRSAPCCVMIWRAWAGDA
jgi:hypothetical protein